jgi:magnesium-transporting ATPase (P-type)
VRLD